MSYIYTTYYDKFSTKAIYDFLVMFHITGCPLRTFCAVLLRCDARKVRAPRFVRLFCLSFVVVLLFYCCRVLVCFFSNSGGSSPMS